MKATLKITKIGNSAGVILPKEALSYLHAGAGDHLSLVLTPNGIELSRCKTDEQNQMAAARELMARRRMALTALAKG